MRDAPADGRRSAHWLDRVYLWTRARRTLFATGWGDESLIERLVEEDGHWSHAPRDLEIAWGARCERWGLGVREGTFDSPVDAGVLPSETARGRVCFASPEGGASWERLPVCLLLAASGDEGFDWRLRTVARPLARSGIGSLILENPFYGSRRPAGQSGSGIRSVSEFLAMFYAAVEEGRSLIRWLRTQGARQVGVSGTSMGGQAAATVAASVPYPIAAVPFLAPSSIAGEYAFGALSLACNWQSLSRSTRDEPEARRRLARVLDSGNLLRLSAPACSELAILLNARNDTYVPQFLARQLHDHWTGSEQRWVSGGHISAVLIHRGTLVQTIAEALQRAAERAGTDCDGSRFTSRQARKVVLGQLRVSSPRHRALV